MGGALLTDTLPVEPEVVAARPSLPRTGARRPPSGRNVVITTMVTWLVGAVIFFWEQVTSDLDMVMGNDGDGRFIAYVHEHWYLALRGRAPWLDPAYFYPVKGVLGYSDTFFLNEVFYAPLRALRVEPLLAYQVTLIALSFVGFCSFVALARRFLRAPLGVALVGAWVFTFANSLSIKAGHAQMYAVYWVPLILLVGLEAWALRTDRQWASVALAGLAGLLTGLLLFSNYYVGWFSFLAAGTAGVVLVLLKPRLAWEAVRDGVRSGWRCLAGGAVGLAVGLVPFALTYLPALDVTGGRKYGSAMTYAGRFGDLLNLGTANLMWSNVFDGRFGPTPERLPNIEVNLAVPPLLVLTTLALAVVSWVIYWRRPDRRGTAPPLAVVLTLTAIVLAVLPVQSEAGSLWAVVWNLVPGAKAIRAIFRIEIVNQLVVALAFVAGATTALRRWPAWRRSRLVPLVAAVLAVALLLEEVNTGDFSTVDRKVQAELLDSVPTPPVACRTFYVTDSGPPVRPWFVLQIDAMMISQRLQLPTINGYSGNFPAGWSLAYPQQPGYPAAVAAWIDGHGLRGGICGYDVTARTWTPGGP